MTTDLIYLLIAFQLKHFLCDYPLQRPFMLAKGYNDSKGLIGLFAHTSVHALFTFGIVLAFSGNTILALLLSIMDFVIHAIVDKVKSDPSLGGRWVPSQPQFWSALGFDQMIHHLTHYFIIYNLLY